MSEIPKVSFYRDLALSEFPWQADMSDELFGDESLDHSRIDKVLLNGNSPKYTIASSAELQRCLEACGIAVDEAVILELRGHIIGRLPETHDKPIEAMSTDPVRMVHFTDEINVGPKRQRKEDSIRIGYSPEAAAEREALIAATLEFCGVTESPQKVWLSPKYVEGVLLARTTSAAGRNILGSMAVILGRTGEDRLMPPTVKLDKVQPYPLIETD